MHVLVSKWWSLVPLAALLASLAASAVMLFWVQSVEPHLAGKLMTRQLWHLALADLLGSILHMPWTLLEALHLFFDISFGDSTALTELCRISMWYDVAAVVSIFIEVHIALATVASLSHCSAILRELSKTLFLIWPLGFLIGAYVPLTSLIFWDNEKNECKSMRHSGLKPRIMTAALLICMTTYACGILVSEGNAGSLVQARVWRQARFFVAAAVVSWGPYSFFHYAYKDGITTARAQIAMYLGFTALLSNGFLNAIVYAHQSRYRPRSAKPLPAEGVELQTWNKALDASYHVAFAGRLEVRPIPAATKTAMRRATKEMEGLDEARQSEKLARVHAGARPSEASASDSLPPEDGQNDADEHEMISSPRHWRFRNSCHPGQRALSEDLDVSASDVETSFLCCFDEADPPQGSS